MPDRILIADDDAATRVALDRSLRRLGYEVLVAADGEEALGAALAHKPQVVLTDIRMPRMDGHTLLRRLRREGSEAVVVVMSAEGDMQDVIEVLRQGAVDYLTKPWTPGELIAAVARALEIHGRLIAAQVPRLATVAGGPTPAVDEPPAPTGARTSARLDLGTLIEQLRRGAVLIPAASPVVTELRHTIASPSARAEDIASLIERDPCLATNVLKISNSAAYSSAGRHSDLRTAVARIGLRAIQNAVDTIVANDGYRVRDERLAAVQTIIWRHSVALALSMRALAEIAPMGGRIEPERAYTCGLLANVGASFLIWQAAQRAPAGALDTEHLLEGVRRQHEEVGQLVLRRWAHDPEVSAVAGAHHATAPPAPPSRYWSLSVVAAELAQQVAKVSDPTSAGPPHANQIDRCGSDLRIGTLAIYRMRESVLAEFESVMESVPQSS